MYVLLYGVQGLGLQKMKRQGQRHREKSTEKRICGCMGEESNLIKWADRRRKQEWWGDRLMPTPPGTALAPPG